ncbi:hypothetical protein SLE2022_047820 [Rubroshorea leprosula]
MVKHVSYVNLWNKYENGLVTEKSSARNRKLTGGDRRGARSRIKSNEDGYIGRIKPSLKLFRGRSRANGRPLRILIANLEIVLGFSILAFLIIFFTIEHLMNQAEEAQTARVVTPFPAPKIMDLSQFQGEHKESLYWGTYRPHVYFGIRSRTPRSLIAGLMWIGLKDGRYFIRHVCQDSDELSRYGWTQHSVRGFGHQLLVDQDMTLETDFFSVTCDATHSHGNTPIHPKCSIENSAHDKATVVDDETSPNDMKNQLIELFCNRFNGTAIVNGDEQFRSSTRRQTSKPFAT